jgi:penicillin-binding protein 1A
MLNRPDPELDSAGQSRLVRGAHERRSSRTAAAGAEFLRALCGDLAALLARVKLLLIGQSHRVVHLWDLLIAQSNRGMHLLRPQRSNRRAPALRAQPAPTRWRVRRLALGAALTGIGALFVISCALLWAVLGLPIERPAGGPQQPTLLLEAADGEPLGRAGPLRVADASLHDFAPILIKAVLSTEDRRFYSNPGVDLLGILRAAHANRVAGKIVEGGSTITQQLVKIEYLKDDRSYIWKLRQALMAIWLEIHLSKDEILRRYLNRVYLGNGAYGMAAAARLYFDKRPADLTLPEAAMLAGLIQAPSQFDPLHHPKAAQARAAAVLDAMVANHVIDAKTANAAKANPAIINSPPDLAPAQSWFTDWVVKQALPLANAQIAGTVPVRTTLVPQLQNLAQQVVDNALADQGRKLGASEGALVAMRPDGAVLAMVGGRDYRKSQFNRATDDNRQPGSLFKLFVYLAALRKGYTPQGTIDAGPIDINGWKPANFDDEHYGRISLAEAFAQSVNTAAVRLEMDVGVKNVVAAARDLGITEPLPDVPSLALGSVGVSLLDLTGAFASVQADRLGVQPWGVAAIGAAHDTRMLATAPTVAARALDPYQQPLVDLLRGVIKHGTGKAAAINGVAAGKTGTSQDYRDAWFIGFNDALVVGVWVGNDNDVPMNGVVGGSLPASIWKNFVTEATPLLDEQGVPVALAPSAETQSNAGNGPNTAATQGISGSSNPSCDVQACTAFYHSFRASDCTYQPYDGGPRQLCEKGSSASSNPTETTASAAAGPSSPGSCNVDLCRQTYSSFNSADCTYQPYGGGPRQLCEK